MSGVTSSLVSCDKLHHYSYTLVTFCRILIFWLHCRAKEASLATDWVPYLDLPLHCICNIATLLTHLLDIPGILIALCNNWSKFGSRWVQRPVICPLGTPGESEAGSDPSNEWEMSGRGRSLGELSSLDQAYIMITTSHYDLLCTPIWGHSSQHRIGLCFMCREDFHEILLLILVADVSKDNVLFFRSL